MLPFLHHTPRLERLYKIYDAVHGFIHFNALEKEVIDTEAFGRLHSIRQLGIAYLVYPGATHTRFEHSLGTMHLATAIFNKITSQHFPLIHKEYWEQIVRLAALCHDLGHLPFSHDAEEALLGKAGHEGWTLKVIDSLQGLWEGVALHFPGKEVKNDLLKMAIGERKLQEMGVHFPFSQVESILSQIVTGDFFGADRIDYLLRDAKCTGVSHGFFDYDQLIEMLCIVSHEDKLHFAVEENGVESCEALLLARHFMHQRVYKYASVKSHKFHLSRFMKRFFEEGEYLDSLEQYLSLTDDEILVALRRATQDQDALALLHRKGRFKAVGINTQIDVEQLREELQIPQEALSVEALKSPARDQNSSLLVQTRSKAIVPFQELCHLSWRAKPLRWIYIDPLFAESISSRL